MKKFLAGSAIASIFTTDDELIAISNTQINDTINLSVESQEVRSGQGNALDYIYYHSSKMEGSLEDAQFNLDYIAQNIGATKGTEAQVYKSVNHKIVQGENSVKLAGIPIGDKIWVYHNDEAATFTLKKDINGAVIYNAGVVTFENTKDWKDVNVCIKYLLGESGNNVTNLTVNANMIPNVVKIVLEAQLFASESGAQDSSRIGIVQFIIPKAQLSGTQEISLSSSGVASTPLSYMALKADDEIASACSSATGVYGYITQILETGNWYDGVKTLAIDAVEDGLHIGVGDVVQTYAITANSAFIVRPTNRITYGYRTASDATTKWVGEDGVTEEYITKDGIIKSADITAVYVKVAEDNSIITDTANIIIKQ